MREADLILQLMRPLLAHFLPLLEREVNKTSTPIDNIALHLLKELMGVENSSG